MISYFYKSAGLLKYFMRITVCTWWGTSQQNNITFLKQNEKEFGSTPAEVLSKNFVLKNLVKPTGKHLQWSSIVSNIEVSGRHLQYFEKFSRTTILQSNCWLMFSWIIFKIGTAGYGLTFAIFWSAKLVRADQFLSFTGIITKVTDQKNSGP